MYQKVHYDEQLEALVKLGAKGLFPLFDPTWIKNIVLSPKDLQNHQDTNLEDIIEQLNLYQGIEKKKNILLALGEEEREAFIRSFFKRVENEILAQGPLGH